MRWEFGDRPHWLMPILHRNTKGDGLWRAQNSEFPSRLQRGETLFYHLIHCESELNSFVPDHKQLASCGRVNARKGHWFALDWIISIAPDRLPRKRVRQSHGILWRGSQGRGQLLLPVHMQNWEGLLPFRQKLTSMCRTIRTVSRVSVSRELEANHPLFSGE